MRAAWHLWAFGGILIGIFGVREIFLAGGIMALLALIVFGPQLLRASKVVKEKSAPEGGQF